jgi:integrase/recombinase XerC
MTAESRPSGSTFENAGPSISSMEVLAAHYLDERAKEPNPNLHTLRAYQGDLGRFIKWRKETYVSRHGRKDSVRFITRADILAYMVTLDEQGASTSTLARAVAAIRGWFKWMARNSVILTNEASLVSTPRVPEHLPRLASSKKMARLCESVGEDNSAWPARDQFILEMLYGSGLLTSELSGLDVDDIDSANKVVLVRGPGSRQRTVPITDLAAEALLVYLPQRADRLRSTMTATTSTPALFINRKLRNLDVPGKEARLTTRSVARIVERILSLKGLSPDINPRTMRTACGVHSINGGADLRSVRQLLGHQSIATTERMKKMSKRQLKEELERTHPSAQARRR